MISTRLAPNIMNNQYIYSLVVALLLPPVANLAHASVVVQHLGANDPETEGFILDEPGGAEVGPVFGDLDLDAWSIKRRSGTEWGFYVYHLSSAEQQEAANIGWTLSATIRLVNAPDDGGNLLRFYTGSQIFTLAFSADIHGNPIVEDSLSGEYRLDESEGGYHEFSLVYDGVTEMAALWIDGESRVANYPFRNSTVPSQIWFGAGQAETHSYWNEVTFAIVPEPATVALLAGLAALTLAAGIRWRKQKPGAEA